MWKQIRKKNPTVFRTIEKQSNPKVINSLEGKVKHQSLFYQHFYHHSKVLTKVH